MENSQVNVENGASPKETEQHKEKSEKMTAKKIKILISVIYGNLFLGSCYSLMAPMFPAEAEKKHASPSSYGLVFGIYELSMFLASPVFGKIMPKLKPGFMMKSGMFVSGVCTVLFGFVDHAPSGPTFIALAASIRLIDALGASAFLTAGYATLGCELPDVIGRAMSITETAFAVGLAGGPVLGGFLYEIGGFRLPFAVVGALLFIGTAVNMFLFSENDQDIKPQSISAIKLLSDIDFLVDILAISTCFATLGFNEASLEPHVRQFHTTPTVTGVIFLLSGLTDAVFCPAWGYFAEKVSNAQYLTFIGSLLLSTCFLIVGPVSFLNFKTNFWVIVFSQFLLGLGMASEIVCSFTHAMKHTVKRGFPNDVGTYSMISGIVFSAGCFGAFLGPSLGGYLIDHIGYIHSTEVIVTMKIMLAAICASRLFILSTRKRRNAEAEKIQKQ